MTSPPAVVTISTNGARSWQVPAGPRPSADLWVPASRSEAPTAPRFYDEPHDCDRAGCLAPDPGAATVAPDADGEIVLRARGVFARI